MITLLDFMIVIIKDIIYYNNFVSLYVCYLKDITVVISNQGVV